MNRNDTLYARWLENRLSEEEKRDLENSGELEELRKIIDATDQMEVPTFDKDEQYRQLQSSLPAKSRSIQRNLWPRAGWAIAAMIVLALGVYFLLQDSTTSIQSNFGQEREYVFEDESRVILNDGSGIRFNEKTWANAREVKLLGEAFFEVEKGESFTVRTERGSVEVLGTSFNVKSRGNLFAVECYTGKVEVRHKGETYTLNALETVRIDSENTAGVKKIRHNTPHWMQQFSKFYNEPVAEVFKELERQYGVKVNVPDTDQLFSGSFIHSDLIKAMEQVCVPLGLQYTISEDQKKLKVSK